MQGDLFVIKKLKTILGGKFMNSKKLITVLNEKISKIDVVILCLAVLVIFVGITPQL
jgi:hypothetical protein